MDSFIKVSRPQFNVSVFNRNVVLSANQKLIDSLVHFLKQGGEIRNEYDDLIEGLELLTDGTEQFYRTETGEFSCSKFSGIFVITMEGEFSLALSEKILEYAGSVCSKNKSLDLNALVAFGKKLESAGQGNYLSLTQTRPQTGVREIIIRKEYVR